MGVAATTSSHEATLNQRRNAHGRAGQERAVTCGIVPATVGLAQEARCTRRRAGGSGAGIPDPLHGPSAKGRGLHRGFLDEAPRHCRLWWCLPRGDHQVGCPPERRGHRAAVTSARPAGSACSVFSCRVPPPGRCEIPSKRPGGAAAPRQTHSAGPRGGRRVGRPVRPFTPGARHASRRRRGLSGLGSCLGRRKSHALSNPHGRCCAATYPATGGGGASAATRRPCGQGPRGVQPEEGGASARLGRGDPQGARRDR